MSDSQIYFETYITSQYRRRISKLNYYVKQLNDKKGYKATGEHPETPH